MNLLPTYELLIAEKLEGIVIPDMADAIWCRIEAALDVEMPVNDPPATPGKSFYKDPAVWISAGVIAIIIALFLLFRSWNVAPPPERDLPQRIEPAIQPDSVINQDRKPPDRQKPVPGKNTRPVRNDQVVDSAATGRQVKERTDTLLKTQPAVLAPPSIKVPPPGIINPPIELKPKKYGVDVSDSDYKFKTKPKD
jgi:hypothetical protein